VLLNCTYEIGPGAYISETESFSSFGVLSILHDSDEMERRALQRHRLTNLLLPQTLQNPMFFHATDASPVGWTAMVDKCAEVGFEMIIYSFGSDFNIETLNQTDIARVKSQVDYAKSKGVEGE